MKLTKRIHKENNTKNLTQKGGEYKGDKSFYVIFKNRKQETINIIGIKKISKLFTDKIRADIFALCMTLNNNMNYYIDNLKNLSNTHITVLELFYRLRKYQEYTEKKNYQKFIIIHLSTFLFTS